MRFEPGDLVLVPFPFSDLSSKKTRPAVVVSSSAYNATGADIVVCGVTSNLSPTPHGILITSKDLVRGTLPATSQIKVDKLATLQKTMVRRILSRLTPATIRRVRLELQTLLGPWEPT